MLGLNRTTPKRRAFLGNGDGRGAALQVERAVRARKAGDDAAAGRGTAATPRAAIRTNLSNRHALRLDHGPAAHLLRGIATDGCARRAERSMRSFMNVFPDGQRARSDRGRLKSE